MSNAWINDPNSNEYRAWQANENNKMIQPGFDQYGMPLKPPPPIPTGVQGIAPAANDPALSPPAGVTTQQRDAKAIIDNVLTQFGLQAESGWAWDQITHDATPAQIQFTLRDRPAFKARFAGLLAREKAGLPPISPAEYVSWENQATQLMRSAGLPPTFYDSPDDFANFIAKDVSIQELQSRVNDGVLAAQMAPPEVRQQLNSLYGVDDGHLTSYFLDPEKALPVIQRQFAASQLSGQGVLSGYGALSKSEAEQLAATGVTQGQAKVGFGQLGQESELFQALPGSAEDNISRDQQLSAQFDNDAQAQTKIKNRAALRQSQFQGGGGYASDKSGLTGVGASQS